MLAKRCPTCNDILIHIEATMALVCPNCIANDVAADKPSGHDEGAPNSISFPNALPYSSRSDLVKTLVKLSEEIEASKEPNLTFKLEYEHLSIIEALLHSRGFNVLEVGNSTQCELIIDWGSLDDNSPLDIGDL